MRRDMQFPAETYKKRRQRRKRWQKFARVCAAVTVFCTVYSLILPAITMAQTIHCGETEHRHDESCYESRLICGYAETTPAQTLPDETAEAHVHTDACYERVLVCDEQEHIHTLSCYSDPSADVESADVWARTVSGVTLSGTWNEDLAAIAQTQLGYRESEKNYSVAWDGVTKNGYTRYGAWYGEPYADWSALFAAFCLHYAGVPTETVPHAEACAEWASMLNGIDLYTPAEDGAPVRGDLIFLDLDADEAAEHVGIVTELADGKIKAIGGDLDGRVQLVTYPADDARILGFARLPENPAADAPETPDVTEPEALDATEPEAAAPEGEIPDMDMADTALSEGEKLSAAEEMELTLAEDSILNKATLLALAARALPGTLQNEINQIAALSKSGTVTLTQDCAENLVIPDDTDITLDLAGFTLSPAQQAATNTRNHITVYGALTITDSSAGGKIENSAGYQNLRAVTVANSAHLTLLGGTISGYSVSGSGAAIRVEHGGSFSMAGGTLAGNTAGYYGGGIYTYDTAALSLTGGTITGNHAEYGGGVAAYCSGNTAENPLILSGVTLTDNHADTNGGGLYFADMTALVVEAGTAICGNSAVKTGGGIFFQTSETLPASGFAMTGGEICDNTAGYSGGGVGYPETPVTKISGSVQISGGTIARNTAGDRGGGLYLPNYTDFTFSGGSIAENHAKYYGGGFFMGTDSDFTMTGGELRGNVIDDQSTTTYGAGCLLNGRNTVTLSGGEIVENAGALDGVGVSLQEDCTLTIEGDMLIARNTGGRGNTTSRGIGLYTDVRCTFTMTGGSITDNRCDGSVEGVGLFFYYGGSYSITGGKITNNTASGGSTASGGGVYVFDNSQKETLTVGGTAEISGNSVSASGNTYGGGIFTGGTVVLCGNAVVRNNSVSNGGGINANSLTLSDNAVITQNTAANGLGGGAKVKNLRMSGGSITENESGNLGGGVYLDRYTAKGSANEITGGEIRGNTAKVNGGGIYLYGHYTTPETGIALHITGGSISENYAGAYGGGVFSTCGARLVLAGGSITENSAEKSGGGVYIASSGYHIFADARGYGRLLAGGQGGQYPLGQRCKGAGRRPLCRGVLFDQRLEAPVFPRGRGGDAGRRGQRVAR